MASICAIMANDDTNGADLQQTNAEDWKQFTIAFISQKLTEHVYCLCNLSVDWENFPSSTVSISAIIANMDTNGADSQWANAGDV